MRTVTRRSALLGAVLSVWVGAACAAYPDKPIKILVPWAAGGATDQVARMLTPKITSLPPTTISWTLS